MLGLSTRHHIFLAFFMMLSVSACVSNPYKDFYISNIAPEDMDEYELLRQDEEPEIYSSDNVEGDIGKLTPKGYKVIGYSLFGGPLRSGDYAIKQARDVGATIVLMRRQYERTTTNTTPLFMPESTSSYHTGNVTGDVSAQYSGTTTTRGTAVVPITTQTDIYDQEIVFLAKKKKMPRYGVAGINLSNELRQQHQRNTGFEVTLVYEETPAFYGNIIQGDVVIEIDGKPVGNWNQAKQVMSAVPLFQETVAFRVLRDDREFVVELKMNTP